MTMRTQQARLDSSMLDPEELSGLVRFLSATGSPALVDENGERLALPKPIYEQLLRVLKLVNDGRAVVLFPEDETFTTQAAANYLGVSRQHFVDLLEREEIPFHRVGTHRRVNFDDLRDYESRRDHSRRQGLDDLMQQIDEADLYDATYTGKSDAD